MPGLVVFVRSQEWLHNLRGKAKEITIGRVIFEGCNFRGFHGFEFDPRKFTREFIADVACGYTIELG